MTTSIWGYRGRHALLRMQRAAWDDLVVELGVRGRGSREAGAFLLADGRGDRRTVTRVVYFDDLDPNCLQGNIRVDGRAFSMLWDLCEAEHVVVIGDVHTHSGAHVHQSSIDAENPMVARAGHVAVIVPHLATRRVKPREVGVHLYGGVDGWQTWTGSDAGRRLFVRRWL
jgi:proteasome lid subunit RPN8/RPN11